MNYLYYWWSNLQLLLKWRILLPGASRTQHCHLGAGIVLIILFLQMSDSYLDIRGPTNHGNQSTSLETIYIQEQVLWATREMSEYFADNYSNYNVRLIIAVVVERLKTPAETVELDCSGARSVPGVQSVSQPVLSYHLFLWSWDLMRRQTKV